jgi:hypothetical protein
MADRYIDYDEVSEYGRHAATEIKKLEGLSDIVNVALLVSRVLGAVENVETELKKARSERSDLRAERGSTADAEEGVRDIVGRFYYHLRSLPKSVDFDFDAFYQGKNLGDLASLKPADLRAKAASVLHGFDTAKNKSVAGFASWKQDITTAHQAIDDTLTGKGGAQNRAFVATASLVAAREKFLQIYNGVAKPIVRGLLNDLGRGEEYRLFFRDLTVNEGAKSKNGEPDAGAPT